MHRFVIVWFLLLASMASTAFADKPPKDDRYRIHVLTMGQGEELFTRFGHIGIMVEDKKHKAFKIYNFGTFDFDDPELQVKYTRGFLNYWLSVGSFSMTVRMYRLMDRDLKIHTLAFDSKQSEKIKRRLEINAQPQNREYLYRHYLDNCCTRIRDIIDDATGGELSKKYKSESTGRTFRDYTREALKGMPFMSTLILFSLGPAIDKPISRWDEQFLPVVLGEDLDKFTLADGRQLVVNNKMIIKRSGTVIGKETATTDIIIFTCLFTILTLCLVLPAALGKRKIAARLLGMGLFIWGLIGGILGLVLILFWTATTHYDTHYNENLLIMPVLHLWLLGPATMLIIKAKLKPKTAKTIGWYLLGCLALIAIDIILKAGPFIQGNWEFIVFAAACNTGAFFSLKRTGVIQA